MERLEKCPYCNVPLTETNSVFIKITLYDDAPDIRVRKKLLCTNCWNRAKILIDEQCTDCKYGDVNPGAYPCKYCTHCYMSHFEEDLK